MATELEQQTKDICLLIRSEGGKARDAIREASDRNVAELMLQTRAIVQAIVRASMAPPGTTQDMLHAEESILRSVYDPTPEGES